MKAIKPQVEAYTFVSLSLTHSTIFYNTCVYSGELYCSMLKPGQVWQCNVK